VIPVKAGQDARDTDRTFGPEYRFNFVTLDGAAQDGIAFLRARAPLAAEVAAEERTKRLRHGRTNLAQAAEGVLEDVTEAVAALACEVPTPTSLDVVLARLLEACAVVHPNLPQYARAAAGALRVGRAAALSATERAAIYVRGGRALLHIAGVPGVRKALGIGTAKLLVRRTAFGAALRSAVLCALQAEAAEVDFKVALRSGGAEDALSAAVLLSAARLQVAEATRALSQDGARLYREGAEEAKALQAQQRAERRLRGEATERRSVTVRVSRDGGATWTEEEAVIPAERKRKRSTEVLTFGVLAEDAEAFLAERGARYPVLFT
jgi:hypothetical protein